MCVSSAMGASFSSGRILGGHMRSHLGRNSANKTAKLQACDMGGTEIYGLRENPKKSWKSSGVNHDLSIDDNVKCGVCGKQFGSLRSLCGHMRHHSVKERNGVRCKECGKGFRSLRSLTGHMRLHSGKHKIKTEEAMLDLVSVPLLESDTVSLVRKKRSNRIRYKDATTDSNSSFCSFNSGFDYDQEEEEVALCLLLLSSGFGELGYSFEKKSLYPNENGEENEDFCADESAKKKSKGEILDSKDQIFECSDCDSDEGLEVAVESGLKRSEFQCRICNKNFATYQALGGHQTFHRTEKSFTDERIELEFLEDAIEEEAEEEVNEAMDAWNTYKEHKCHICSRNFKSGQALGGHKRAHIAKAKEEGNCSIIKHELLVLDVTLQAKNGVLSF